MRALDVYKRQVLDPKDVEAFMQLAAQENLEATVVATVTDRARMRMTWRGKVLVDLERAFLDLSLIHI